MSLSIDGSSPPFNTPRTDFASSSEAMKPIEKKVYDLCPIISKLKTQESRSVKILGWHEQILLETYESELLKRLPDYHKKIKKIFCRDLRNCKNLQSELLSMREKCIYLFKDLNKPHFFLDFGIKPTYFDTLPHLVSLYKKIEESPDAAEVDIRQFYEELTVCGSFAKALEVVQKVSNKTFLDDAYLHISSHMPAWGDTQEIEALQLANTITDTKKKEVAFHNISTQLAIKGKYESAMMLAGILSDYEKQNVISIIVLLFARRNRLDEAIQLVETMTTPSIKDWAYCDIAIELELEKILHRIQSVLIKDHAISEISLFYAKAGKLEEAIKLSSTITDPSKRTFTIYKIAFEEGIKLVNKDTDFAAIARVLAKQGHLKEAIRLAEEIRDPYIRDYIFRDLAIELARNDQCEAAALLASSISDPMNKDSAFSEISILFAKKGQLDEAVQLSEMITEEMLQGFSFWKISRHMKSEEAIQLCNKITHKMYQHMALYEIFDQLKKLTSPEEYILLASTITIPDVRNRIFKEITPKCGVTQVFDDYLDHRQLDADLLNLIAIGRFTEAIELAKNEEKHLAKISIALAKAGQFKEAIELGDKIRNYDLNKEVSTFISNRLSQPNSPTSNIPPNISSETFVMTELSGTTTNPPNIIINMVD